MKNMKKWSVVASIKKMVLACGLLAMVSPFVACDDDDESAAPVEEKLNITVILGTLGMGDNDYCSMVYEGVKRWENNPNVKMDIRIPKSIEHAVEIYHDWAKETVKDGKSLMVVANGEYAEMVNTEVLELKENQQVLAFEMKLNKPLDGVHAFQSNHSGVAYLAGTMASLSGEACVVYAKRIPLLDNAGKHFNEGFKKYTSRDCKHVELANDFSGFDMPDKVYELMKEHPGEFILPLAGFSNAGLYNYLQDCDKNNSENTIVGAGVDLDYNALSPRIAFSYMINIDKALDQHLNCWLEGKPWPNATFGLEDGITEIRINPDFTKVGNVTKAALEKMYKENFDEAAKKDMK